MGSNGFASSGRSARTACPNCLIENLLVEPEGRDTAPAVAWSTIEVAKALRKQRSITGFFPADHWIAEQDIFESMLVAAAEVAVRESAIVTLGITPTQAATGYGYIEQGEKLGVYGDYPAYRVDRFTEKPDRETAEKFVSSGRFSWNGGMFVFQAKVMLDELRLHAPEILEILEEKGIEAYSTIPKKSIDYALMEKTNRACVLPVRFGWDDLGDWGAIERLMKSDSPNVELGQHVGLDTSGAIVYTSDKDEVVVTIGLEDTVIVRDGKVTLIVKKDRTQEIKAVLKTIQARSEFQDLL